MSALFLGFGQAMLGVSGFESSANTIEEQRRGIFPFVLRNMWLCVSFFNPLLSIAALSVLPQSEFQNPNVADSALLYVARASAGKWLEIIVAIDAAVVLSGAVLTAFVGVSGLARRMALDRCLPAALLQINSLRGTMHWIPIAFFLVTTSLAIAVADPSTLAAVYSLSFLGVMGLFAVGCLLLKQKRPSLPRPVTAWTSTALWAILAVTVALASNVVGQPTAVRYFALYGIATACLVYGMLFRVPLLAGMLPSIRMVLRSLSCLPCAPRLLARIEALLRSLREQVIVIFAKHADLVMLNKALLYARRNEQTSHICIVHVLDATNTGERAAMALKRQLRVGLRPDSEELPRRRHRRRDSSGSEQMAQEAAKAASALAFREATRIMPPRDPAHRESSHERIDHIGTDLDLSAQQILVDSEVSELAAQCKLLDVIYPKVRVDLLIIKGAHFGRDLLERLGTMLNITTNLMFISCPDDEFGETVASLGGVRVITSPSRPLEAAPIVAELGTSDLAA